jgi:hypothetical protein
MAVVRDAPNHLPEMLQRRTFVPKNQACLASQRNKALVVIELRVHGVGRAYAQRLNVTAILVISGAAEAVPLQWFRGDEVGFLRGSHGAAN